MLILEDSLVQLFPKIPYYINGHTVEVVPLAAMNQPDNNFLPISSVILSSKFMERACCGITNCFQVETCDRRQEVKVMLSFEMPILERAGGFVWTIPGCEVIVACFEL